LAVNSIEKGHMCVCHGRIPPPTFSRTKHRHWVKRIRRVTGFDTRAKPPSRQQHLRFYHYTYSDYDTTFVALHYFAFRALHGCQHVFGNRSSPTNSRLLRASTASRDGRAGQGGPSLGSGHLCVKLPPLERMARQSRAQAGLEPWFLA